MSRNQLDLIQREIESYFGFLFEKGYKISYTKDLPMGDWKVVFDSSNVSIMIYSDRGEVNLVLSPIENTDVKNQYDLRTMVYFISNEQEFIGKYRRYLLGNRRKRFEILAGLLRQYLDRIAPYFGHDFEKYKHELFLARQKYGNIFMDQYILKKKT